MKRRFSDKDGAIVVTLPPAERAFMSQVLTLLADVGDDPDDPALRRLNVPVYLDDSPANEEWWRLMGGELDDARTSDRRVYARVMDADDPVTLAPDEADAFLRVLNEGRLAFAARLGLEVADDHDRIPEQERQALDFLGWILEELTAELSTSL